MKSEPVVKIDDVLFHSCLCHDKFQHPLFDYYYSIYRNYEKGFLPYEGSLMDQPAKVMEAIDLFSVCEAELKTNEAKKAKEQQKVAGKK